MPRTRTGHKGVDILQAAQGLFVAHGVSATSMARIAKAAGIGVGTLYLYYPNKDAVVVACAQAFAQAHSVHAQQVLQNAGPPTQRLRDYVLARHRLWQPVNDGTAGAAELAHAIARLCPEQMSHFANLFTHTLQQLLRDGAAAGCLKAHDAAAAATALVLGLTAFFPFPGNTQPLPLGEAELLRQVDWFLSVALAPPETGAKS